MTRAAFWLLGAGVVLFAAVLVSQGLAAVLATLAVAGWGLPLVALLHVVPLVLDAVSIRVMFTPAALPRATRESIVARWLGESANSFLPAGPIGGPVVMARYLSRRGMAMDEAAAAVTVSTTLQTVAQMIFALMGVVLLTAHASIKNENAVAVPLLIASGLIVFCLTGFYWMQRRGLFGKLMRAVARLAGKRDWSQLVSRAHAIDAAVQVAYTRGTGVTVSFVLSLAGWLVGTAEVYLILRLLRFPVGWGDALLLESLGQAIRAAGFAIPGSLGVQEGGYLLLAPVAGLTPEIALALSLAKRAREVLLGLPGLVYLHRSERGWK